MVDNESRSVGSQPGTAGDKAAQTEIDALGATVVGPMSNPPEQATTRVAATPPAPSKPASSSEASASAKVTQLGDFKLMKKLGKGGMGEVFLAKQVSLDRLVALKTLSKELAKKADFVQRFLREARSMAKLQHQNVVQIYAADSFKGVNYVAIEFVDGKSMQGWMNELGKLSVGDALHVIIVCAEALRHAHGQNMIHRDIKPDNILVTKNGVVKVADFGLAKALDEDVSMTQSGTGLGTPLYMAPEQARNAKHVDHRTDIYALGSMLYYFLTGKLPFTGENTLELIMAKEKGIFPPVRKLNSECPERLDLMIGKMIAKDPQHRYADCNSILRDLTGLGIANASLSFINSPDAAVLPISAGPVSRLQTTSANAPSLKNIQPVTSAEDAARQAAAKKPEIPDKVWYVRHTNAEGKVILSKMSTGQVLAGIKTEALGIDTKLKPSMQGDFLPLASFPEFESIAHNRAVKATAETRASNTKSMYAKLDAQERRRKRWRWLGRLLSNVKGGISLIIWLACVGAVIFAGWYWGYPFVKQLIVNYMKD